MRKRFFSVQRAGLTILALLHSFYSAKGLQFTYNGFTSSSDLLIVAQSNWLYSSDDKCYNLVWPPDKSVGRILHPEAVQMREPGSSAVKSFSTTFIFQIYNHPVYVGQGSGLAFIMVPNNSTVGAPNDYLGLLTTTTSATSKDVDSDDHTVGVEFDTYLNAEFDDPNSNHIGLDLASMNSSSRFIPAFPLTTAVAEFYYQVWIDFVQADSRMDVYIAQYQPGGSKPNVPPISWSPVDLSLLSDPTFIGFSAAVGLEGADRHTILAWSFSTEGDAPPIFLAKDTPIASPPPPGARTPTPPPPGTWAPPPPGTRAPPPPGTQAPPSPPDPSKLGLIIGLTVSIPLSVGFIFGLCWLILISRPLRIFLSHTGGEKGESKTFPTWLNREMRSRKWSRRKFRVKVFFDVVDCKDGQDFPKMILRELKRFDVGMVVVKKDFFESRWCMVELIEFVDAQKNDTTGRLRVLPLFYELTPAQLKEHLNEGTWENVWTEFSKLRGHPLKVEDCRQAVQWLSRNKGIKYPSDVDRDRDGDFIETILQRVDRILCEERSFTADLRRHLCPTQATGEAQNHHDARTAGSP